ncbi:MAG: dihydropteroate synthase [Myxococcota bacterium]
MSNRPKLVAILNITEDSFSDGGRYLSPAAALAQARDLISEGADILELGPASSNPDAQRVPAEEQIARLRPVLEGLRDSTSHSVPISIDATEPEVIRFALKEGVAFLNDIRGFPDPELHDELASGEAALIVMHSLLERDRATRDAAKPEEVLDSVERFFESRLTSLTKAGVAEDRLIIDPGMGFFLGSNPEASLTMLRRIPELRRRFGRPVLISVSRKSFLRKITGSKVEAIGPATLAAELYAAEQGADFLRTHDVAAIGDALKIRAALAR